jgi:hypothetical protein
MRIIVGVVSLALIAALLAEFFVIFLLPRRVKREPRIARGLMRSLWRPWRAIAARLPGAAADTMLGIFGPLGLLTILALLSGGVMIGFAGLHWAISSKMGGPHPAAFLDDLYFSAGAFFTTSTANMPSESLGKLLHIAEAASGIAMLFISIGYLPALFQSFSRRETAVARLDPRAGSPPSAAALLERSGLRGGWSELDEYMREWESWTAELMETHLSYPILGYFRSQHVNQNWLAALVTVVDACAYAIAYGPAEAVRSAQLTYAIGRHALADLAYAFDPGADKDRLVAEWPPRLTADALAELRSRLEGSGLHVEDDEESERKLEKLRRSYEPNAIAIADQLALNLPGWLPSEDTRENWRTAVDHRGEHHLQ